MWQNLRWEINAKFKEKIHRHVSSFQVIILGFMLVILLGSLCLTLPLATRDGQGASFLDALFTSTSAVCVTGLVLHDTASYWSMFGQAVILFLIQIGGMGVVTVSVAVAIFSGRKISLMQRSTMRESISAPQVGRHRPYDGIYPENGISGGASGSCGHGSSVCTGFWLP